jgi:titin
LVINRFTGRGIHLANSRDNVVEGNFIGTDASGTLDLGNNVAGVVLGLNETRSRIGGTSPAARNLISGNGSGVTGEACGQSNQISGNLIGTDITGAQALANSGSGVSFAGGRDASGTIVGGAIAGARNIISGNSIDGVSFARIGGILVQGNFIGTDVTGTVAIPNRNHGIGLFESSGITIGGSTPLARNVISGNLGHGINATQPVGQGASSALVIGNFIGTQADGVSPLGNGGDGVHAPFSPVGGAAPGEGNIVAFNRGIGVLGAQVLGNKIFSNGAQGVLVSGSGLPILGNSIFDNGRLGIDLSGGTPDNFGVNPNDPGDTDSAANFVGNNGQNFPVLHEVLSTAVDATIVGSLNSLARTDFLIQFFANDAADPSGHGEGQTFLGETTVRTNAAGNVSFSAEVLAQFTPGQHVTATATRLFDDDSNPATPLVPTDTSEFSRAIAASASILELGQTIERDLPQGQEINFRLFVPPGTDARLTARFLDPQIGEILVRAGDLPDENSFADRAIAFVNPDPEFLLPGLAVPYFISVRGTSTANVALGRFSLT